VARYGQSFKDRAVARLLPPESATLELVSKQVGIAVDTLQRWRDGVQSMPARGRAWTAPARLQAVITTAALSEADLFARNGDWSLVSSVPDPGSVQPQDRRLGSARKRLG